MKGITANSILPKMNQNQAHQQMNQMGNVWAASTYMQSVLTQQRQWSDPKNLRRTKGYLSDNFFFIGFQNYGLNLLWM